MGTQYNYAINILPLKPTIKFVLITMADYTNQYGLCTAPVSVISKETGLSERQVYRAILQLIELNLIEKRKVLTKKGWHIKTEYIFLIQPR